MAENHLIDFPSQSKTLAATDKAADDGRITSEYIERERSFANESAKVAQRERIGDFFLRCHRPNQHLSLLSLPGLHWQFEHELLKQHKKASFVGLDWTWGVIELGRPYMPGERLWEKTWTCGAWPFHGFRTGIARWVFCKASKFFSYNRSAYTESFTAERQGRGSKQDRADFARKFKSNSCIWLDFTSQLCTETRAAIQCVSRFADMRCPLVPICITVMAARDDHHSDQSRVDEIWDLLGQGRHRNFAMGEWWGYIHNGIPMLNVMGWLTNKGERRLIA